MVTKSWFNTPKPGNFEIACAELCGLGHYRMRGYLTVHNQADFDAWYNGEMAKRAKELAPPPPPPAASAKADTAKADTAKAAAEAPSTDTAAASSSGAPAASSSPTDTAAKK
jgi:cytochrome c oxidase subunit 2